MSNEPTPQSHPIPAHGGTLINRLATDVEEHDIRQRAPQMKKLVLTNRESSDLDLIAVGAFSPLQGFMGQQDYQRVVSDMRLADGTLWSLPVTLSATKEETKAIGNQEEIALYNETNTLLGVMTVEDTFSYDKQQEASLAYGTTEEAHPGVAALYQQKELLVGGSVTVVQRQDIGSMLPHRCDPIETRQAFLDRGWRTVVGFQTRNPVHRAHEYIQKAAMELVDGLLLHPLVGETKSDDIPAEVRMKCYEVLLENYYPQDRTHLSILPAAMRYAGPREAVFHALIRKNYGCTHFIVGRDHAGVGNYYGTYAAQDLLRGIPSADLEITPLFFDNSFFCKSCGNMASAKTCPHSEDSRISLSGTQVRDMLQRGELPPPEFSRPEVAAVLVANS